LAALARPGVLASQSQAVRPRLFRYVWVVQLRGMAGSGRSFNLPTIDQHTIKPPCPHTVPRAPRPSPNIQLFSDTPPTTEEGQTCTNPRTTFNQTSKCQNAYSQYHLCITLLSLTPQPHSQFSSRLLYLGPLPTLVQDLSSRTQRLPGYPSPRTCRSNFHRKSKLLGASR